MIPVRILLIDDDDLLCDLLATLLGLEGYEVTRAANGEEGLAILNQQQFDVILLDLLMPRLDGLRFLRILRETGQAAPPIIVLSASATGDVSAALRSTGIAAQIRKPVQPETLLETLAIVLAGRKPD